MLEVELVRAVAAESPFEVVLLVVQFPRVGPAPPGIHGSGPRRSSVGFAGRVACIPGRPGARGSCGGRCDRFFDSSEMRAISREMPTIAAMMMKMMF